MNSACFRVLQTYNPTIAAVRILPGSVVGITGTVPLRIAPGTVVGITGAPEVTLGPRSVVSLTGAPLVSITGAFDVRIAPGTVVGLTGAPEVTLGPGTAVGIADGANLDAFSRLRVAGTVTVFDAKMLADNRPLLYDDAEVSGSGTTSTYNTTSASVTMAVSATTAGRRVRQSRSWVRYQPGKSQLCIFTGVIGVHPTGVTARIGLFNDNDGLFFESSGEGIGVVRRTSTSGTPVDNRINQASWNIDPMDGTGPSGITLDLTRTNIFLVDFQWLGVGRVRFGLDLDGQIVYCHEILNANTLTVVYMATPNLPVRYEIENDGTGAASDMVQICAMVASEGGTDFTGVTRAIDRGGTPLVTSNTAGNQFSLIAIRLKSGYLGATVVVRGMSILCTTNADIRWWIAINPGLSAGSFTWTPLANSAIEYDAVSTDALELNPASPGTEIASGYENHSGNTGGTTFVSPRGISIGSAIDGTSDIMVLGVQRLPGGSETVYGSLLIEEGN